MFFLSFALNLVTILVVHNVIINSIELVVFREDEEFLISTLGLLGRYLQHEICFGNVLKMDKCFKNISTILCAYENLLIGLFKAFISTLNKL